MGTITHTSPMEDVCITLEFVRSLEKLTADLRAQLEREQQGAPSKAATHSARRLASRLCGVGYSMQQHLTAALHRLPDDEQEC